MFEEYKYLVEQGVSRDCAHVVLNVLHPSMRDLVLAKKEDGRFELGDFVIQKDIFFCKRTLPIKTNVYDRNTGEGKGVEYEMPIMVKYDNNGLMCAAAHLKEYGDGKPKYEFHFNVIDYNGKTEYSYSSDMSEEMIKSFGQGDGKEYSADSLFKVLENFANFEKGRFYPSEKNDLGAKEDGYLFNKVEKLQNMVADFFEAMVPEAIIAADAAYQEEAKQNAK